MPGKDELENKTIICDNNLNDEMYQIAWSGCKLTFLSYVQELRRNILLCDCKIVVAGSRAFFAHKAVLAASSSLLKNLLEEDKSEQSTIILTGVSASDMCALLEYIYNGFVKVSIKQLSSLLMVAQSLGITSLEKQQLSNDNQEDEFDAPDPLAIKEPHATVKSNKIEAEVESQSILNKVSKRRKRIQPLSGDNITWSQNFYYPSESPAKCPYCHIIIKQGRNMPRHLSLKHSIFDKPKITKKTFKTPKLEIIQMLETVANEETVVTSPEDEHKPFKSN